MNSTMTPLRNGPQAGPAFDASWQSSLQPAKDQYPTTRKQYKGTYMGHEPTTYEKNSQQSCINAVEKRLRAMDDKTVKRKPSSVTVSITDKGLAFCIGEMGAAKFEVDLKDVACVALSPKHKGGKLKLVSVLCRSANLRRGLDDPPQNQCNLVCHIWRPSDQASLWDFYIAFEKLLASRDMDDPYLTNSNNVLQARSPQSKATADNTDALLEQLSQQRDSKPTSAGSNGDAGACKDPYLAVLTRGMASLRAHDAPSVSVDQLFTHKVYVRPTKDNADSDIELDFTDSEDEGDDAGSM